MAKKVFRVFKSPQHSLYSMEANAVDDVHLK